jgi:hypothetical protein
MELNSAIKEVSDKFVYTADKTENFMGDNWFVMKEAGGKYYGDCEDFSLTVMYLLAGSNMLRLLWNIFIGKYKLHAVASNGVIINHCVGEIDNIWFDNWVMSVKNKDEFFNQTKHIYGNRISFFTIFSKLIMGKLFGKK